MTSPQPEPSGDPLPTPPSFSLEEGPVLLYDGECGFCNRSVQWILNHERDQTLRFSPIESTLGHELVRKADLPSDTDSLLWFQASAGKLVALKWSDSVIAVLEYVGGPWRLLSFIRWIPSPLRDWAYRRFARERRKLMPLTCFVPSPETKKRFLTDL